MLSGIAPLSHQKPQGTSTFCDDSGELTSTEGNDEQAQGRITTGVGSTKGQEYRELEVVFLGYR